MTIRHSFEPRTSNTQSIETRTLFRTSSQTRRAHGTVRVDPTTLGANDHHGHLEGSLGYPRPSTLPQNSIGSLRGDVRPHLCQSGLSTHPVGSVVTIRGCMFECVI
ncbi:hypothetical protein CRG98_010713 [Punica granatum]|uniref:Uncharacterized protein n=1 Tax=Punica granatum TaxID=22663 RepID=A0A2I0KK36_PUNGR|nr:hypothetical protein CRG98_010713 [Punica granatum]